MISMHRWSMVVNFMRQVAGLNFVAVQSRHMQGQSSKRQAPDPKGGLATCILSSLNLVSLWWSCVLVLRINFFFSTLNNWLIHLMHGDTKDGMFYCVVLSGCNKLS